MIAVSIKRLHSFIFQVADLVVYRETGSHMSGTESKVRHFKCFHNY